ncbi:NAD(P)/FAD-dependent oxidoreductase [Halovivax limisalsi]|uniref:NAD(P)/FAD-dependent oxidoreductase n=1 Tax=Halovivax limisalsi TaxID=1453760 RepID=UPI001FFC58AE|nr:NAD(P)/FAD-dependent oxidoreductase [Halovivax limisalsi]
MTATSPPVYEVAVVGGGPAGLTTALYTTRLGHRTALFEREGGRHAAVDHVHNLLGVSEAVSGQELADHGIDQLEAYGGDVHLDSVEHVERIAATADGPRGGDRGEGRGGTAVGDAAGGRDGRSFRLEATHATVHADCVVLATGFSDRGPDVAHLERYTGRGLYYCLHCDAYDLGDGSVYVLGHDDRAAHVAMLMLHFTDDVDLLLDDRGPDWSEETAAQLRAHPVERVDTEVVSAYPDHADDSRLGGLAFGDGTERDYLGGFAMYGSEYNATLAEDLGCELADDGAVAVDEDRRTSVDGVYAVGDLTHGQNQTPIAMGDGAYAGLAIHEALRSFPKSLDDLGEDEASETAAGSTPGALDVPGADPAMRARMRRVRDRETLPGLRTPDPNR